MTFIHNELPIEIPELKTKNINRKRFYETPEGKLYPSITTVLQKKKMVGLSEWRKRVGDDVANYIARTAAARGTKVHKICEDYLNNMDSEYPSLTSRLLLKKEMMIGTNPTIFKHLHIQRCLKNELALRFLKL
jgi:hypothetical protein